MKIIIYILLIFQMVFYICVTVHICFIYANSKVYDITNSPNQLTQNDNPFNVKIKKFPQLLNHYDDSEQNWSSMKDNKCFWLLGFSGTGKTTLANTLAQKLSTCRVKVLDGDILRNGINNNLSFSSNDRYENVRRTAELAKLFVDEGYWVIVALITPLESMRQNNRAILGKKYVEIFIDTPIELCEQRDPKGLYAKVAQNQIKDFTGKDSPFECPANPDLIITTQNKTIEECTNEIFEFLTLFDNKIVFSTSPNATH